MDAQRAREAAPRRPSANNDPAREMGAIIAQSMRRSTTRPKSLDESSITLSAACSTCSHRRLGGQALAGRARGGSRGDLRALIARDTIAPKRCHRPACPGDPVTTGPSWDGQSSAPSKER